MRKLIVGAALIAAILGGAAACANRPATPSTSASPTATAAAADQTKDVCAEATTVSTANIATLKTKLTEGMAALTANDTAKLLQIQAAVKTLATEWTGKLTELSGKPIKPEVKTVLTNGATTITTLSNSLATTTPAAAEAQLTDFTKKLATACAV